MSSYVEKLLPILVYPLGFTLLLCITAFALSFAARTGVLRVTIGLAIVLLWLASTPAFAGLLMDMLEEQNPSFPIETISPKDVVIVLSGGLARPQRHLGGRRRPRDPSRALMACRKGREDYYYGWQFTVGARFAN